MTPLDARPDRISLGIVDGGTLPVDDMIRWFDERAPDIAVVRHAVDIRSYLADADLDGLPDVTLLGELREESARITARIAAITALGTSVIVVADDLVMSHWLARSAGASHALPRSTRMPTIAEAVRRAKGDASRPTQPLPKPRLSPSEHRALEYYALGHSINDIATAMHVQYETAKTFLRRVRAKYQAVGRSAASRAEVIARATEDGFL